MLPSSSVGLLGQFLQRRAAGQQVVHLLLHVARSSAAPGRWHSRPSARRGHPRRRCPRPARMALTRMIAGPRSVSTGPTSPGSVSAKTASPAAPSCVLGDIAHVDVVQRQPALGHQGVEIDLALLQPVPGRRGLVGGAEDQPLDQPPLGLLIVWRRGRRRASSAPSSSHLDLVDQHRGGDPGIGDRLGLGQGVGIGMGVVPGLAGRRRSAPGSARPDRRRSVRPRRSCAARRPRHRSLSA